MKPPEEIAKALHLCYNPPSSCDDCPYDECKDCVEVVAWDAEECIRALVNKLPRWISVKERLPEEGELVVFIPTINQGSIYVGKLSHTGARGGVLFENRQGRTTMKYYAKYWMPLPEPPKEE